jgi:hypothetical protein
VSRTKHARHTNRKHVLELSKLLLSFPFSANVIIAGRGRWFIL